MEVDEFQLLSHLLFFGNLVGSFYDLGRQGGLLVFVLLNQGFLLPVFLLEKLLDSLSFDIAGSTVLSSHQNLPLEIIGVLSDLCDSHVGLLKDGSERL